VRGDRVRLDIRCGREGSGPHDPEAWPWVHKKRAGQMCVHHRLPIARGKSSTAAVARPGRHYLNITSSRPYTSITLATSRAIDAGVVHSAVTGKLLPTLSPSFWFLSISRRRPGEHDLKAAFIRPRWRAAHSGAGTGDDCDLFCGVAILFLPFLVELTLDTVMRDAPSLRGPNP